MWIFLSCICVLAMGCDRNSTNEDPVTKVEISKKKIVGQRSAQKKNSALNERLSTNNLVDRILDGEQSLSRLLDRLSSDEQELFQAIRILAKKDPEYLREQEDSFHKKHRAHIRISVLKSYLEAGRTEEAINYTVGYLKGETKYTAYALVGKHLAESDLQHAVDFFEEIPFGKARTTVAVNVVENFLVSEPSRAIDWMDDALTSHERTIVLQRLSIAGINILRENSNSFE